MSDITIVGIIIACVVVLFVTNRVPVIVVAMATPLALWATGVLSLQKVLSGFGDPAVIFIAALFVVSAALEQSGVTAWAGQWLIAQAGEDSRTRLLLLTMVLVALLTALISVNGAVAALLPVVVVIAVRLKRAPSQLLMPLAFAAHAGSVLALTGSPVNVLVSNAAVDVGLRNFQLLRVCPGRNSAARGHDDHYHLVRRATAAPEQRSLAAFGLQQARTHTGRAVWAQQWLVPPARKRIVSARGAGDSQTRSERLRRSSSLRIS